MTARADSAKLEDIQSLRALFLQETNFQIRYDACHRRGWTDSYVLKIDDVAVGYGSIKGQQRADRDTIHPTRAAAAHADADPRRPTPRKLRQP